MTSTSGGSAGRGLGTISGGWAWHWRALRRRSRWASTCQQIDTFHRQHGPRGGTLLLLGCSAGWMLSSAWLQTFGRIVAVDPDRWAPHLFALAHPRVARPAWIHADALADLARLLRCYPDASLLFDNMLGQQGLIAIDQGRGDARGLEEVEESLAGIKQRLAGRCWGSLHDCISGPVRPQSAPRQSGSRENGSRENGSRENGFRENGSGGMPSIAVDRALNTSVLLSRIAASTGVQAHGEWLDHLTAGIFPATLARNYLLWRFSRTYWHWLEIGWVDVP